VTLETLAVAPPPSRPKPQLRSIPQALDALADGADDLRAAALSAERTGAFPVAALDGLRAAGLLHACAAGGCTPLEMMEALRCVGRVNLSLGRIFEGHVNGARLVDWYGDRAQREALNQQLADGESFGVWNTEPAPGVALRWQGGAWRLVGAKSFATGAGYIDRAVITAALPDGQRQMLIVRASDLARADPSAWKMRGMRTTVSGPYDVSDLPPEDFSLLGRPGDYLKEPRFSAGAWRFTAVQLGGVERILALLRGHLVGSAAGQDPIQRARFADALTQARSSYLWVREAAVRAESTSAGADEVAVVLLARRVVEQAGLAAIQAAQRTVGTRAFRDDDPLDLACRDLDLYLRQPAPDQAFDRAAQAFIERDCWRGDRLW
jgi:alkylation response protein AidB-like acyl-CoA dehydrogenase